VVVTGESQRGHQAVVPSRLLADESTGAFGAGSVLTDITGTGHASLEETTAAERNRPRRADRIEAHFAAAEKDETKAGSSNAAASVSSTGDPAAPAQIRSAVLDGHVVLLQQPLEKPGVQAQAPMRATAGRPSMKAPASGCT